ERSAIESIDSPPIIACLGSADRVSQWRSRPLENPFRNPLTPVYGHAYNLPPSASADTRRSARASDRRVSLCRSSETIGAETQTRSRPSAARPKQGGFLLSRALMTAQHLDRLVARPGTAGGRQDRKRSGWSIGGVAGPE